MSEGGERPPLVSVIVPTYDRPAYLEEAEAKRTLARAFRHRPSPRTLAAWSAAWLPGTIRARIPATRAPRLQRSAS